MRRIIKIFLLSFLQTIAITNPLLAGVTGKIAGKITDKSTGEPLIGANIIVIGTNLGAATDLNGQYHRVLIAFKFLM